MNAIAPETIDLSELPHVLLDSRDSLPIFGGVYIVFDSNQKVLYVGRSENIRARWINHQRYADLKAMKCGSVCLSYLPPQNFHIKIAWIEVKSSLHRYVAEAVLIDWFKPVLNSVPGVINKPLAQLRIRAGLRAVDVGYHLSINESTVRNWEKGRTIPTVTFTQIDKLMELYNCSYEELRDAVKESMAIEEDLDPQNPPLLPKI